MRVIRSRHMMSDRLSRDLMVTDEEYVRLKGLSEKELKTTILDALEKDPWVQKKFLKGYRRIRVEFHDTYLTNIAEATIALDSPRDIYPILLYLVKESRVTDKSHYLE